MRKSVLLFWSLFVGVIIFAFGVQFAYSQVSNQFPTTSPSSGAHHTSSQVACNNCITSGNIADGTVDSSDIKDGTIRDQDIGNGAGIFSRKINGANGWHFTTGIMPNRDTWYPAQATDLVVGNGAGVMGMGSWTGAFIELSCDPAGVIVPSFNNPTTIIPNGIRKSGGLDFFNLYRYTDLVTYVSSSMNAMNVVPYAVRNQGNTFSQSLRVRSAINGANLEFSRGYVGNSPPYPSGNGALSGTPLEPEATAFECVVKILSLCREGPLAENSCGPVY
jgi:hypothetical protein